MVTSARVPRWALVLGGWLCGIALLEARDARSLPSAVPVACTLEDAAPPPRPPSTREWRGGEGIGRSRALALARARWELGPGFDPEEVRGIGPVTAERVRTFLREHSGAEPPALPPALPDPPFGRTPRAVGVHSSRSRS